MGKLMIHPWINEVKADKTGNMVLFVYSVDPINIYMNIYEK